MAALVHELKMTGNSNRLVTLVLLGWVCFAVALTGSFHSTSAPAVAATVWTLTALALIACWKIGPIRAWALNVDVRWLVLFHLTRLFAGLYFLMLCHRGELSCAFAFPAAWGDIIVAVLALPLVTAMRTPLAKTLLVVWNTIGLIDIVFVVFSALRFGLRDWQSMHALRELPLSLLPMFLVPLIIASHVLIFFRVAQARGTS
ncbi:MAG: hypothetical protein DMF07_10705 [Verrucomicrobia bacterium]|nr:MAG: hypothetical protein DMF07_10705 [Verrucomicrobiota bacterium]